MPIHCRTCGAELLGYEFNASGGGSLGFPVSGAFEELLSDLDQVWDGSEPFWLCRYLDGYPCFECGTVEVSIIDPTLMLKFDGHDWPRTGPACRVCQVACRGPRRVECEATAGNLLAHLAPNFGAPLQGRLCETCWRVWLSLYPDDSEGREELVRRFEDRGTCSRCGPGHLRETYFDVPHAGIAHLGNQSGLAETRKLEWEESQLRVSICDSCGEADVWVANRSPNKNRRTQP